MDFNEKARRNDVGRACSHVALAELSYDMTLPVNI